MALYHWFDYLYIRFARDSLCCPLEDSWDVCDAKVCLLGSTDPETQDITREGLEYKASSDIYMIVGTFLILAEVKERLILNATLPRV